MSGQAWPTQTESWPSGTGLTRCVCLYTCVCACAETWAEDLGCPLAAFDALLLSSPWERRLPKGLPLLL